MAPLKTKSGENVQVVVRCRPLNSKEVAAAEQNIVKMDTSSASITLTPLESTANSSSAATVQTQRMYTFDSVYPPETTQQKVYMETVQPILDSVIKGFNGTIFCYGQTGTGKTHTMEGVIDDPELRGIMPNCFYGIFSAISACSAKQSFLVQASFLEIYKDDIFDLLNTKQQRCKMDLKEDKNKGVFVKDLSTFKINSPEDLMKVIKVGQKTRRVGATKMNEGSSRSHSILTITIESSEKITLPNGKEDTTFKRGKLNLVDLAGSERQKKTEATGERLEEAKSINWSLTVLGNCIQALISTQTSFVPYRDSKLTRLLQDSLGGNTKTVMIANIGPAGTNFEETLNTLRYADRAKQIKNIPKVNMDGKDFMLKQMQDEIEKLKQMLEAKRSGNPGFISDEPLLIDGSDPDKMQEIADLPSDLIEEQIIEKIVEREGVSPAEIERLKAENAKQIESIRLQKLKEKSKVEAKKAALEDATLQHQEALELKRAQLSCEDEEISKIESMIQSREHALMHGGEQLEKARQQQLQLKKIEEEIKWRKEQQGKLKQDLHAAEENEMQLNMHYDSVQEELASKTEKMKRLWEKYKEKKAEIENLQSEFSFERDELVETVRNLARVYQLKELLVKRFIPATYLTVIENECVYEEWNDEWKIRGQEFTGCNVCASPPS